MSLPRRALPRLATAAVVLVFGCATGGRVTSERRADGIYHLRCNTPLPECLREAENLCQNQRYAVLRAFDARDLKGDTAQPAEYRSSEAFVRCSTFAKMWVGENKDLKEQPLCPAPPLPAAPPPPQGCTPGLSQACVGPAACKGGQVCLPDGAKFGPCDCGAIAVPPPITP